MRDAISKRPKVRHASYRKKAQAPLATVFRAIDSRKKRPSRCMVAVLRPFLNLAFRAYGNDMKRFVINQFHLHPYFMMPLVLMLIVIYVMVGIRFKPYKRRHLPQVP